jgi:hypothetical protein
MKSNCKSCNMLIINSHTGRFLPDGTRAARELCIECLPENKKSKLLKRLIISCPSCGSKRDTQSGYESKRSTSLCEHCSKRSRSTMWAEKKGITPEEWSRLSESPSTYLELQDKLSRSVDKTGYTRVGLPKDHPLTSRAHEHRLVMSAMLGRWVSKHEIVHHINGDRTDNRIENLQLLTHAEHAKGTAPFCKECATYHANNHR